MNQAMEEALREVVRRCWQLGPGMTPSEWAEATIWLGSDETDDHGQFSLRLTPYLREIIDCIADPEVTDITLVFGSQVGKTLALMIMMGYMVANDPSGVIYVMPNQDLAKDTSVTRWMPLVTTHRELKAMMPTDMDEFRNLSQRFQGATVTWVGAHSTANLSSRPRRVVIQDEVDKFPDATEKEARSIKLADARCSKFNDPKRIKASTPSTEHGPIWLSYQASDMRTHHVPCPHCGTMQALEIEAFRWDPAARRGANEWDLDAVERSAAVECLSCKGLMRTEHKTAMNTAGRWVPARPEVRHHRGYRLPSWYAPWQSRTFGKIAREFLECKASFDMQYFDTNIAARPYVVSGERVDPEGLAGRGVEEWTEIPAGVLAVTAGVDVQDNRLEVEIVGWGEGHESWSLEYHVLLGDTERDEVWDALDRVLWTRRRLPVLAVGVDRGGHRAQKVYEWTRPRNGRRVYAVYGASQAGKPVLGRPVRAGKTRVPLFPVGVDTVKGRLYSFFQIKEPGPGYCHFPKGRTPEYYKGLTSEELRVRTEKGRQIAYWHQIYERNEPLDTRVYAYAALHMLPAGITARKTEAKPAPVAPVEPAGPEPAAKPQPESRRIIRRAFRLRGWAGRF